jgi:hypothetical protein
MATLFSVRTAEEQRSNFVDRKCTRSRTASHTLSITQIYCTGRFKNSFTNGIPHVTVWRVLRKRLHLKECKPPLKFIKILIKMNFNGGLHSFKCKRFRNTLHTVTFGIPFVKLFFKRPVSNGLIGNRTPPTFLFVA